MNDLPSIPVVSGSTMSEADERLIALFDKLEEGQLEFLDQAARRVIELSTAMLAVLFGVTAFGKDFPPPYLASNVLAKGLALATLGLYLLALFAGVVAVQPRPYSRSHAGLDRLRLTLEKIVTHKRGWYCAGIWLFLGGSLALAALIVVIILAA